MTSPKNCSQPPRGEVTTRHRFSPDDVTAEAAARGGGEKTTSAEGCRAESSLRRNSRGQLEGRTDCWSLPEQHKHGEVRPRCERRGEEEEEEEQEV